jgi:hypothetical protein
LVAGHFCGLSPTYEDRKYFRKKRLIQRGFRQATFFSMFWFSLRM